MSLQPDALDAYLSELAGSDRFSGALRVTRGDDELFAGAYGPAVRAWNVPNTIDTRFDTASITKLFTGVLVLQTVEKGLLRLDTRTVDYLGLEGTAIHPEATLQHLTTHTSGIADDADEEAGEDYAEVWKTFISYTVRETVDHFPQFVDKPGNFAPGEGCRYCNVGFILAGAMVEKATGSRFIDLVTEQIFAPAGMVDSGFFSMDIVEPGVAEGADPVDGVWVRNIYSYPPIGSPDGGAHCTVTDLERFMTAARDGRLLNAEMTERFLTPQAFHSEDGTGSLHMGYGIEFDYDADGNLMYLEKEGMNAGVSGFVRYYPDHDITVAMLCNMENGAWEPRRFVHEMIHG